MGEATDGRTVTLLGARPGSGIGAFVKAIGAFGPDQLVCAPPNTGNRRNQTGVQFFTYQPPGGPPPPDPSYRVRFDWIDSNTDAPAVLIYADADSTIVVQDRQMSAGYNVEHWVGYPPTNRWDIEQDGVDLGSVTPIDDVLHLMGVQNAASCPDYGSFLLAYQNQADRDTWEPGTATLAVFNRVDDDQKFLSTLFGQLRAQLHGTIVSVYDDSGSGSGNPPPYTGGIYAVIDWTVGSPSSADPDENLFLDPPLARGVDPGVGHPAPWVVEPPVGNFEGSTTVGLFSRAIGQYGTHPVIEPGVGGGGPSPKPETKLGWLDTNRMNTAIANFNPLPTPGTQFTCTRL